MKIRKFNESLESKLDTEYIKECFVEMLDNNTIRFFTENSGYDKDVFTAQSYIKTDYELDNFDRERKYLDEVRDKLDIMEECMDKVLMKYDINYKLSVIGNIMAIKFYEDNEN